MERDNFAARFRKAYQTAFNAVLNRYKYGVPFFIRQKWLTWSVLVAGLALPDAEQQQVQYIFDCVQGVINLYHALGGGA